MTSVVKIAVEAALAAGKIQAEHADKIQNISEKSGLRGDVVTEVDLLCEKEIIGRIQKVFPLSVAPCPFSATNSSSRLGL